MALNEQDIFDIELRIKRDGVLPAVDVERLIEALREAQDEREDHYCLACQREPDPQPCVCAQCGDAL